jgi:8-oxo-dGTP pyrophosphatase MutT (NUDIX family)
VTRDEFIARVRAARPVPRRGGRGDHNLNPGLRPRGPLRPAAVLVPLVDRPEGLTVFFTKRTDHLADHAGQISFPGGRIEPDDPSPEAAALREVEEEIGVDAGRITLLGRLDDYATRTGFLVTPVIGVLTPPFVVKPDPHEVAAVFEVPLDFVVAPASRRYETRMVGGVERRFYAFPYGEYYIWGVTAGILVNLCERVIE